MKLYLIFFIFLPWVASAQYLIKGRVTTEDLRPLAGATVRFESSRGATMTNGNGDFELKSSDSKVILMVSYIGLQTQRIELTLPQSGELNITMHQKEDQLEQVIVSTGYQVLSPERTTGSFSKTGNELLQRRVSTDLISRLEDLSPGLVFNKGKAGAARLLIRGQHTINSSAAPLIIIDNFPYDGDLSNINPNDVESVTLLKDASAASIWGSRAGNGVIVVTTRAGIRGAHKVTFNTNFTFGHRPDIFYQPKMSTADFIDLEKGFFNAGRYTPALLSANKYPLTPVAELLAAVSSGQISSLEANSQIEQLKRLDVRNDYHKYLYQNSLNQQYSLGLSGGNKDWNYYLAAGYDHNRAHLRGNENERFTINLSNKYRISEKLQAAVSVYYTGNSILQNARELPTYTNPLSGLSGTRMYPYARLADSQGTPLEVINEYRLSFIQDKFRQGFLDWSYSPLQEMENGNKFNNVKDLRLSMSGTYNLNSNLALSFFYQLNTGENSGNSLYDEQSYFSRNQVNKFTLTDTQGNITRPVPLGAILDQSMVNYRVNTPRLLVNYNKSWNSDHDILSMAGFEFRDYQTNGSTGRLYGYDPEHATAKAVDFTSVFRSSVNPANTLRIENKDTRSETIDRYISYYANTAYTYKHRYTISLSGRRDLSNLYGVASNQKGVPLWSAGLAWNIHKEKKYNLSWIPLLKLRATYGSAGNSNKNVSAYTTAAYSSRVDQNTGLTYATIINPPNPELRWEQVTTLNFGLDFQGYNQRFGGAIDYYQKQGKDLIGTKPYPGASGIKTFTGNYAHTKGYGIDAQLTARWLTKGINWNSTVNLSYVTDKVVKYDLTSASTIYLGSADGLSALPLEGRPLYSVYSLPWAGLDSQTGDPMGYIDGKPSKDYFALINIPASEMVYNGPARPTVSGAIINTFTWENISLSANINYKLGYYFRSSSISYRDALTANWAHGDYNKRWQQPGDEATTYVPSFPQAVNDNRDAFYAYSQPLVRKGDHIRLQDINLSYQIGADRLKSSPFSLLQVYLYVNHIGILWKADNSGLDPDYYSSDYRPPLTTSIGLRVNF